MADITLRSIQKSYGAVPVIRNVDLHVADGEFCVFVGPSGCGKSTLLRMIAGLEDISAGDLLIGGQRVNDVPPARRGVAMVFQSYALFPHLSVRENMSFGLSLAKLPKAKITRKVDEAARVLQLEALLDRKPKQLSGGNASVSPSAAPSCASQACFSSTNHCPTSTLRCVCKPALRSRSCITTTAAPAWCTSRTIRSKR